MHVYGIALSRSALRDSPYLHGLATTESEVAAIVEVAEAGGPAVLLVDDADATDDQTGALARLLGSRRDDLWCVAGGRADVLRVQYGHWTAELRRSRMGLALRPNVEVDGDLWHTPLPRRQRGVLPPGRGYLVADGMCELLQAATP